MAKMTFEHASVVLFDKDRTCNFEYAEYKAAEEKCKEALLFATEYRYHDLEKDANDLPTATGSYLVRTRFGVTFAWYSKESQKFSYKDVIGWAKSPIQGEKLCGVI